MKSQVVSAMRNTVVLLLLAVATQAAADTSWRQDSRTSQDVFARQAFRPEIFPIIQERSPHKPPGAGRASDDYQSRVINGDNAARGQFPWHAYIVMDSSNFCGGSLISSTWVLTAGYCTGHASYTVNLGVTNLLESQEGVVTQVSRYWIMHAEFEGVFTQKDVAVIRLSTPVSFTDFISTVRLPRRSQATETFSGLDATVVGFGRLSSYNFTYSPTLQYAQVKIVSNDECAMNYPLGIYDTSICSVGENGRNACEGDNGGAMVIAEEDGVFTVVGIKSFHLINCPSGAPVVFARVTSYLSWLETYAGVTILE